MNTVRAPDILVRSDDVSGGRVLALRMLGAALWIAVVGDIGDGAAAIACGIEALHREASLDAIVTAGDIGSSSAPCRASAHFAR